MSFFSNTANPSLLHSLEPQLLANTLSVVGRLNLVLDRAGVEAELVVVAAGENLVAEEDLEAILENFEVDNKTFH